MPFILESWICGFGTEMGTKVSSLKQLAVAFDFLDTFHPHTFLPTSTTFPSADQERENASPPTSRRLTHDFVRTSQKHTVPSAEQLASSASRTGLNAIFSMPAVWPFNSVEYRTFGRSGFQIRSVRSAEPVAMSWPVGFHARVRSLSH